MDQATREQFAEMGLGGFGDALGLVIDELEVGRVRAHLDCGPAHHQPFGIVHGGVHAAIVETLGSVGGAFMAAPDGKVVVGVNNTTDFIRAHREGRIDAVAEPIHVGRLQHLWQVVITRASDGKTVARGQLRLQVIDPDHLS